MIVCVCTQGHCHANTVPSEIDFGSLFAPPNAILAVSNHPRLRNAALAISGGARVTSPKFKVYRLAQGSREVFSLAQEAANCVKQYIKLASVGDR